jgi:hypothetical protein
MACVRTDQGRIALMGRAILKWPFGQAFNTTLLAMFYSWLNTKRQCGFGCIQGFPFIYLALNDGPPSIDFIGTALAGDVLIGAVAIALVWKFGPKQRVSCSGKECLVLGIIAAAFTWANREAWYGGRPTLWNILSSPHATYGVPFTFYDTGPGGAFHPGLLVLNLLILFVTLAAVSHLFHHREKAA